MKCIECSELKICGTIKRYLLDFNKSTLLKELNREMKSEECKDFSFTAISGEILKHKLEEMTKLSSELKASLKQAKNTK